MIEKKQLIINNTKAVACDVVPHTSLYTYISRLFSILSVFFFFIHPSNL